MPKHTTDAMSEKLIANYPAEKNASARALQWRRANGLERWSDYVAAVGGKAELQNAYWQNFTGSLFPANGLNSSNWFAVTGANTITGGTGYVQAVSTNAGFSAITQNDVIATPVWGDHQYLFSIGVATQPTSVFIEAKVNWYDASRVFISTSTAFASGGSSAVSMTPVTLSGSLVAPSNAAWAAIQIGAVVPIGQTLRASGGAVTLQSDPRTWGASRDYYQYPFRSALVDPDSIWNRPIGTGATFLSAGLAYANAYNPHGWARGIVTADREFIGRNPADPTKTLTVSGDPTFNGHVVRVPATMAWNGSWNGCWALISNTSATKIVQGQPLTLTAGGSPSSQFTVPAQLTDLVTDTGRAGSHGGSWLSTYGGSLRQGELTSSTPIRHALKVNLYGQRFYSKLNGGYRWPAFKADTGYATSYNGSTAGVHMGTLLALPYGHDISWITDSRVRKLAMAFKHYGAYVVDDTAWDVHAVVMDDAAYVNDWPETNILAAQTFHSELQQLFTQLSFVSNNASGTQTSGGGDPVAPRLHAP